MPWIMYPRDLLVIKDLIPLHRSREYRDTENYEEKAVRLLRMVKCFLWKL